MRIALFTDVFLPFVSGVVTEVVALAEALADRGHHVFIIVPCYPRETRYAHPNVEIIKVSSFPAFFYEEFRFTSPLNPQTTKILNRQRPDIIHFHTPFTLGMQAILIAKFWQVPLVGTFHTFIADPQYLDHVQLNTPMGRRLSWEYSKLYYNRCDLITVPTKSAKAEMLKHGFTKPIKVLSNGLDLSGMDGGSDSRKKAAEIQKRYAENGPLLLFVGRVAYEKNLPYLFACFRLVRQQVQHARLLVVGGGPEMKQMRREAAKLGLGRSVIFVGSIPYKRLFASGFYQASDLFVTASVTETQGLTVIEAQANGLPSVCVDAKGVKDVVSHGHNGFLVREGDQQAFADAVLRVLRDEKLRARLGAEAVRDAARFDIRRIAVSWERTYALLLKRKAAERRRHRASPFGTPR